MSDLLGASRVELPDSSLRPFFIVNSWRTGSTLLAMVLGVHREIVAVLETRWFAVVSHQLHELEHLERSERFERVLSVLRNSIHLRQLSTPGKVLPRLVEENLETPARTLASLVEDFASRNKPGARIWVEKSCLHSFYIPDITLTFPKAKFIHLVRDPRATVNSIAKKTFQDASNEWRIASHAYYRFNRSIETGLAGLPGDRKLRVHYENLVRSPSETLEQCCEFLDIPFDEAMLRHERFTERMNVPGSENAHTALSTKFLDEWKNSLKPEQVRCIERFTNKLDSTACYEPAKSSVSRTTFLWQLVTLLITHAALRVVEYTVEQARRRPFVFASLNQNWGALIRLLGMRTKS